jgi:hypothetical protein
VVEQEAMLERRQPRRSERMKASKSKPEIFERSRRCKQIENYASATISRAAGTKHLTR